MSGEHSGNPRMWLWMSWILLGGVLIPLFLVGHHRHRVDILHSIGSKTAGPGGPRLVSFTSHRSPFLLTTPADQRPHASYFWGFHSEYEYTCADPTAHLLDGRGWIHSTEEIALASPTATAQFTVDGHEVAIAGDEVRVDGRVVPPRAPGEPIEVDLDALAR